MSDLRGPKKNVLTYTIQVLGSLAFEGDIGKKGEQNRISCSLVVSSFCSVVERSSSKLTTSRVLFFYLSYQVK